MGARDMVTTVNLHVGGSTPIRVDAFDRPDSQYGHGFVSIGFGDVASDTEVIVMVRNLRAMDRLLEAVADARSALLRVTRDAEDRQPALLAS